MIMIKEKKELKITYLISSKNSSFESISFSIDYFLRWSLIWASEIFPLFSRISSSLVSGLGDLFSFSQTSSGFCSVKGFLKFGGSPRELFIYSDILQIVYASYSELLRRANLYLLINGMYSSIISFLVGLTTSSVIIPSK